MLPVEEGYWGSPCSSGGSQSIRGSSPHDNSENTPTALYANGHHYQYDKGTSLKISSYIGLIKARLQCLVKNSCFRQLITLLFIILTKGLAPVFFPLIKKYLKVIFIYSIYLR